jgi:hypothetical protein
VIALTLATRCICAVGSLIEARTVAGGALSCFASLRSLSLVGSLTKPVLLPTVPSLSVPLIPPVSVQVPFGVQGYPSPVSADLELVQIPGGISDRRALSWPWSVSCVFTLLSQVGGKWPFQPHSAASSSRLRALDLHGLQHLDTTFCLGLPRCLRTLRLSLLLGQFLV